jgi:asparagine N-glycosylation enzyme membrane subunit Stt3
MKQVWKVLWKILKVLFVVVFVLFVVYFWNLDQKVLGWVYTQVNRIHDRKNVDIKF